MKKQDYVFNDVFTKKDLFSPKHLAKLNSSLFQVYFNMLRGTLLYWQGVLQYWSNFMSPYGNAMKYFIEVEAGKSMSESQLKTAGDYMELLLFNMELAAKGASATFAAANQYHIQQMSEILEALRNSLLNQDDEDISQFSERQLKALDLVVNAYPKAIEEIDVEYGFHFDNGGYAKVAETDRFILYRVLPSNGGTSVREGGKPILIIPPYVLGANILSFLPAENRSYVHAYANTGIPTYIRIVKDIANNTAVQLMNGENDALDTRFFCEKLVARHGRPVTLNGFCQGGYVAVLDLLSGELDGLVDALITCVAPIDGSRSKALVEYLEHLPPRFRDIGYSLKTLPNGNKVVDGEVMSWLFKLKSMEAEAPLLGLYRNLQTFSHATGNRPRISKLAAAVNRWLLYDRSDLPVGITQLSFDSYTNPIAKDGTLPVRLFGRPLNLKRIEEKGIKWLICIAEKDDLVDSAASLAPLDYIDAQVSVFPKGHASLATSWPLPASECSLLTYCDIRTSRFNGKYRGPVKFQLDLDGIEVPSENGGPSTPHESV